MVGPLLALKNRDRLILAGLTHFYQRIEWKRTGYVRVNL
jgi:hypothetical protein